MKTYNFNNNNNASNNRKANLDNYLMNALAAKLGAKRKPEVEVEIEIEIEIEKPAPRRPLFSFEKPRFSFERPMFSFEKPKKPNFGGISYCSGNCANCRCGKKNSITNSWASLIAFIESMFQEKPDYDFKDIFGRPVRVFSNFIQVGYDIIPKYVPVTEIEYLSVETRGLMIEMIDIKERYARQF